MLANVARTPLIMASYQHVVIGYASEPWCSTDGAWYDTHIGGVPVFPPDVTIRIPPCSICTAPRVLVLQAYAPHSCHQNRVIYVFGCNNIKCSSKQNAWWAIRACQIKDMKEGSQPSANKSIPVEKNEPCRTINWDTDSGDDSSEASDLADDLELLSLQVQLANAANQAVKNELRPKSDKKPRQGTTTITTSERQRYTDGFASPGSLPQGPENPSSSCPGSNALQAFFVHVTDEPKSPKPLMNDIDVDRLLREYIEEEQSLATAGNTEAWAAETEEEQSDDRRYFEAFQERMQRAPGHILRYAFGGTPLWPKYPPPDISSKVCGGCGSKLFFELQILGSCLHYLQPETSIPDHQCEAGMNFASLAIFTCSADCTMDLVLAESPCFKLLSQTVCIQHDEWQ